LVCNGIVLVGDTGHVAAPMTGAGVQNTLLDVAALAADSEGRPDTVSPQFCAGMSRKACRDLEETPAKVSELSREELHIVGKRAEVKIPARNQITGGTFTR
jgi:hypothetical protein